MGTAITNNVAYHSVEKKGTFQLFFDRAAIENRIRQIPDEHEVYTEDGESAEFTMGPEHQKDMDDFMFFMNPELDWKEFFDKIPRKANGTFAKNRVVILKQGHSFSYECQDSYGDRGPELRIKTLSDTEAHVEFHRNTIINKW